MSRHAKESLDLCQGYCMREQVLEVLASALHPMDTMAEATQRMVHHGFDVAWEFRPDVTILVVGRPKHPNPLHRFTERIPVPLPDWDARFGTEPSAGVQIARAMKRASKGFGEMARNVEMETDPFAYGRSDMTAW